MRPNTTKNFENWFDSPSKTAMNQLRKEKPVAYLTL